MIIKCLEATLKVKNLFFFSFHAYYSCRMQDSPSFFLEMNRIISSFTAQKSFFSLSTFRGKGNDSKPR